MGGREGEEFKKEEADRRDRRGGKVGRKDYHLFGERYR